MESWSKTPRCYGFVVRQGPNAWCLTCKRVHQDAAHGDTCLAHGPERFSLLATIMYIVSGELLTDLLFSFHRQDEQDEAETKGACIGILSVCGDNRDNASCPCGNLIEGGAHLAGFVCDAPIHPTSLVPIQFQSLMEKWKSWLYDIVVVWLRVFP